MVDFAEGTWSWHARGFCWVRRGFSRSTRKRRFTPESKSFARERYPGRRSSLCLGLVYCALLALGALRG